MAVSEVIDILNITNANIDKLLSYKFLSVEESISFSTELFLMEYEDCFKLLGHNPKSNKDAGNC